MTDVTPEERAGWIVKDDDLTIEVLVFKNAADRNKFLHACRRLLLKGIELSDALNFVPLLVICALYEPTSLHYQYAIGVLEKQMDKKYELDCDLTTKIHQVVSDALQSRDRVLYNPEQEILSAMKKVGLW